MNARASAALAALCCAAALLAPGCKSATPPIDQEAVQNKPVPSYASVAKRYNERINLLPKIWAKGPVSIRFTNAKGERQWEQGNGYLLIERPDRVSFSISKFGDEYVRMGSNGDRFWAMDVQEKTARVGDVRNGAARIDQFGLPISSAELFAVFGIAPLPAPEAVFDAAADPEVRWSPDGRHLVVTHASSFGRIGYLIDPQTYLPVRVELLDGQTGKIAVGADLTKPTRTPIPGRGGFFPQVAGQVDIRDFVNDSEIKVTFGTIDATREIDQRNFDLDTLMNMLGPFQIVEAE